MKRVALLIFLGSISIVGRSQTAPTLNLTKFIGKWVGVKDSASFDTTANPIDTGGYELQFGKDQTGKEIDEGDTLGFKWIYNASTATLGLTFAKDDADYYLVKKVTPNELILFESYTDENGETESYTIYLKRTQ